MHTCQNAKAYHKANHAQNASIPHCQHAKMPCQNVNLPKCKICQKAKHAQCQHTRTPTCQNAKHAKLCPKVNLPIRKHATRPNTQNCRHVKIQSTTMQSVPNAKHYKLPAYQLSMHVTVAILPKIQTCQITKHQGASKPDSILSILHACQITKYVKSKHTAMKTCQGQTFQLHTNQNANVLT